MSVSSRSILEGLQIGNALGAPIARGMQQSREQDFEKQMQAEKFKNMISQALLENPDLASGLAGTNTDANGNQSQNALSLSPDQIKAWNQGGAVPQALTIQAGGQTFDPVAIKKAQLEDTARKFEMQKELANIAANGKMTYTTIDRPEGTFQIPNKGPGVGTAIPVMQGSAQIQGKPTQGTQFTDATGNLFMRSPGSANAQPILGADGKQLNLGVANKFFDTAEGMASAPEKSAPGTTPIATPLTTGEGQQLGSKSDNPAAVVKSLNNLEPIKHYNDVKSRADTIPALLQHAQTTGNYTIADPAINEELQRLISNQAIRGTAMNLMYKGQPLIDKVEGFFSQFQQGGNRYTPETRQQAVDTANILLQEAQKNRDDTINAYRSSYPNKNLFDTRIGAAFPGYQAAGQTQQQAPQKLGVSGTTSDNIKFKVLKSH